MGQNLIQFTISEAAMGTRIKIIFYTTDSLRANEISRTLLRKVHDLNAIFSDYDTNSELVQLCRTYDTNKQTKISDDLFDILQQANKVSKLSNGSFDVTVGPYTKMWRQAKKVKKLPTAQQLAKARNAVGYQQISFNEKNRTIRFKEPEMQIDLGGIAKGYTADELLKILKEYNINQALIDFGGDISVSNPPPDRKGWNVEISHTNNLGQLKSKIITTSNMSIATSGDYYQKLSIGDKAYSHIINPSSGLGITESIQVTVIAPSGTLADSFASAFSVMCKSDIKKLVKRNKDVHVFITTTSDNGTDIWCSEFFNKSRLKN